MNFYKKQSLYILSFLSCTTYHSNKGMFLFAKKIDSIIEKVLEKKPEKIFEEKKNIRTIVYTTYTQNDFRSKHQLTMEYNTQVYGNTYEEQKKESDLIKSKIKKTLAEVKKIKSVMQFD